MKQHFYEISSTYALISVILLFYATSLHAEPERSVPRLDKMSQDNNGHLTCTDHRKQFTALRCAASAKTVPSEPSRVWELEIPKNYGTSLIWETELLKFSQELYSEPPKDLRKRSSEVLRLAIVACAKTKQCENELLEYFGLSNKSGFKLPDLEAKKDVSNDRNELLAATLGEKLYEADAGKLIRRFLNRGECARIIEEAKRSSCELSVLAR